MHYTVFDFAGTGGVALAMYNTDTVCVSLFTAVVVISEKMLFCEIIVCVYLFRVNHAI